MIKAKKSEGSKDKFNAKVASYEFAFMLIKRAYSARDFQEFRDIAKVRPYSEIYKMLKAVPETLTRSGIKMLLPEYRNEISRLFSTHADPLVYNLRGVALYGISECVRSEMFMSALCKDDYQLVGKMMKISHDGDRIKNIQYTDELLDRLAEENADIALQSGSYDCSTTQIDELCDLLNDTDGVLGSELVGAGLGGCVVALVEETKSESIIEKINSCYYDKYGFKHSVYKFSASNGSSVIY